MGNPEFGGAAVLEQPPQKKGKKEEITPATPAPLREDDTHYLRDASKEDLSQSLRTIEFQEITKPVKNLKEFGTRIDEKEFETQRYGRQFYVESAFGKAEIAILDELPALSGYEEFRFYLARRIKKEETFTPETVVLAQHKDRSTVYLASYADANADYVNTLDEQRFLTPHDRSILASDQREKTVAPSGEVVLSSGTVAGSGGEGVVSPALRRPEEKFFPESGVLKKRVSSKFESLKPESELIVPLKEFLASGDRNATYVAHPLTMVSEKKDTAGTETQNVFWELVVCKEKEQAVLLNLEEAISCDLLNEEQKMTALLHLFRGLDFLAKHGITHGDIKPKNLFLTNTTLKIGDFGLMLFNKHFMDPQYAHRADALSSVHAYKDEDVVVGTPQYIHPRRYYHNAPETIHPKHDVFSAAMLAIRLLTGYVPPRKFLENFAHTYQDLKKEIDRVLYRYQDDHPEAVRLVSLLQRSLTEPESMVKPPKVEEILPAAEKFVQVLEAMGVNESLDIKLPNSDVSVLTTAVQKSSGMSGTTIDLPKK